MACLPPASQALAAADASRWTFITQARGSVAHDLFLGKHCNGRAGSHAAYFIGI